MKVELKLIVLFEAFDDREWGANWGYYTTEEEAQEAVNRYQNKWTNGSVKKTNFKVPVYEGMEDQDFKEIVNLLIYKNDVKNAESR